ncbi:MAG: TonB-dependent receptor plug domain-containing protein, partial [Emcibacteraceae bacterium]|nr:TonB-dependent receptor plug domain-containing protein [Emcibacteraceae bacterium]
MNKKLLNTLLISTSIIFGGFANAAEDAAAGSSVVVYDQVYFEKLSPVTLLDMLQAVPGVTEILNKNRQQRRGGPGASSRGERGFGSGGDQILMDGKRLAGKANSIDDTLSRISASQVERIELIRGASAGLDVQSQGLVINVVMRGGVSTSTTFWQVKGEYSGGHQFEPEYLISHNGSKGKFDYSVSYEHQNNDFFFNQTEDFYEPDGTYKATREIAGNFDRFGDKFSTNLGYEFNDGSRLRLNGLFEPNGVNGEETRDKTSVTLGPIFWAADRDVDKWEVGGDYSRSMGSFGSLKTLFVVNSNKEDVLVNRFNGSGDERFEYTRDITTTDRSEKIFRASITKGIAQGQSLEFGGEAAFNTFDKKFENFDRADAVSDLIIDNSDNVEIKENRYEIFANHSYNISSNMVLQSSWTTEFSKIVADNIFQGGDVDTRNTSFTYHKPRINFRYDLSGQDQIRLLIEKKISQLNFNNFVTRFDQQELLFKFGNTNIRPEQTWDFSAAFEHRFPNDSGSVEGEVFYRKYTDHISVVDFTNYVDFGFNPVTADEFFSLPPDTALRDYVD